MHINAARKIADPLPETLSKYVEQLFRCHFPEPAAATLVSMEYCSPHANNIVSALIRLAVMHQKVLHDFRHELPLFIRRCPYSYNGKALLRLHDIMCCAVQT